MGKIIEPSQLSGLETVSIPTLLRMITSIAADPNNTPDTIATNNAQFQNSLREAFPLKHKYLSMQVLILIQNVFIVVIDFFINACKIDLTEMTQTSAIRLSAHHKPHPNMGKLRHNGTVPIKDVCPSTRVVIERPLGNMSFALITECGGKYTTFLRINK